MGKLRIALLLAASVHLGNGVAAASYPNLTFVGDAILMSRLTTVNLRVSAGLGSKPNSQAAVMPVKTEPRPTRILQKREVLDALQMALAKKPLAGFPQFGSEDLTLSGSLEVPEGDAGLVVTEAMFDEAIGRARFRLRARSAPNLVPFYVTAPMDARDLESPTESWKEMFAGLAMVPSTVASVPALVDPRQTATLRLHSANSEITLQVRPLQRGRLGETIRVRMPSSGKTLDARVVGSRLLDAVF